MIDYDTGYEKECKTCGDAAGYICRDCASGSRWYLKDGLCRLFACPFHVPAGTVEHTPYPHCKKSGKPERLPAAGIGPCGKPDVFFAAEGCIFAGPASEKQVDIMRMS